MPAESIAAPSDSRYLAHPQVQASRHGSHSPTPPWPRRPSDFRSPMLTPRPSSPSPTYLSLLDLELMHHWTIEGCFSFSSIREKYHVWQVDVPKEALKYEFLMHALLAISAVHLMYTRPERYQVYEKGARIHRNMALSLSIPHLNQVTAENCHALFAMSNIVANLAFVFPHSVSAHLPPTPLDDILNYFVLLRGAKTILKSAAEWITQGPLAELARFKCNPSTEALPEDIKTTLDRLVEANDNTTESPRAQEIYESAIRDLRTTFQTYSVVTEKSALVSTWPVIVDGQYIQALRVREPMALSILAHYIVFLQKVNDQWFSKCRVDQLLEAIDQTLPREWRALIEWPKHAIQEMKDSEPGREDDENQQAAFLSHVARSKSRDVSPGQQRDPYEQMLYREQGGVEGEGGDWNELTDVWESMRTASI